MATKQADFYCENCKRSVSIDAPLCPFCGATFSGVKCPNCSFSAGMQAFVNGCPQCGYSNFNTLHKATVPTSDHTFTPPWVGFLFVAIFLLATVMLGLWYLWQR